LRTAFFITLASVTLLAFIPDYSSLPAVIEVSDLANHTIAFATLTLLYRFAYSHTIYRLGVTLIGYGAGIEVVQAFLPTRSASLLDLLSDIVGILFGIWFYKLVAKRFFPQEGKYTF